MKKIEETFLKEGDFFLARWKQGYTLHLINGVQELFHRKFTNNIDEITTETNMTPTRLEDTKKEDYLYLNPEKPNFFYGSLGITPARVKGYWIVPETSGVAFSYPNVEPPSPSRGDDYGYFDGRTNPIYEPTDHFAITIPPGIHPNIDLYNPYDDTVKPTLSMRFAHYSTEVINFKGCEDIVRKLLSPSSRRKRPQILPMGNQYEPIEMRQILIESFGVKPLPSKQLKNMLQTVIVNDENNNNDKNRKSFWRR